MSTSTTHPKTLPEEKHPFTAPCYQCCADHGFEGLFQAVAEATAERSEECDVTPRYTAAMLEADPALLEALKGVNHMAGDERGGYCICPLNNGSAPDAEHATDCASARTAIRQAEGTEDTP